MRKTILLAAVLFLAGAVYAQRFGRGSRESDGPRPVFSKEGEFHFVRLEYTDNPQYHRGWGFASRGANGSGWWMVDWPEADDHFTTGLQRLTRIEVAEPHHFGLNSDEIYDHPWVYVTQAGWWGLSDAETKRLGEYLLRGGFLVTDDFWGAEQWSNFERTMARALPKRPIYDIGARDSVMHVLYDIEEKDRTFIPGTRHLRMGAGGRTVVQQPPGSDPIWRAMYDDSNRMVVAINFNTDVGDAWEYADAPEYPAEMTTLAYKYGVNYVVYAMTH